MVYIPQIIKFYFYLLVIYLIVYFFMLNQAKIIIIQIITCNISERFTKNFKLIKILKLSLGNGIKVKKKFQIGYMNESSNFRGNFWYR